MWLLASLPMFTSCSSVSVATDCAWAKVITVSKDDVLTDETARQLLAHNRTVEAICR
jgi:hypothetical protein